ncbi:CopG family ribbon-helix-helix protein [Fodinicurvata sediminis]|uniref:CopG family ribbon-helix-helix protein n=1 Tax=Fodinicurvata sediminis TaxID=1121832 RepID=UPI00041C57BF|nr:hypothetical protein [Fodinicurvata sediminis]
MTDSTFTFRVDDTLKETFSAAAKAEDQKGAQLLRSFMREYVRQHQEKLEHDAWFLQQVQHGLAAANEGDLLSAEDVEAEAERWRAEIEQKLAGTTS